MIEMEKQRSLQCGCLESNVAVESLVITLTIISALAITGDNLLLYDLITVPKHVEGKSNNNGNSSDPHRILEVDAEVLDILDKVFHYTSIGVAGIFLVEIIFKLLTLQKKFCTKPYQIFDMLVVLATCGVEIAFHLVDFDEPGLHSVTYIVLLRLWRIPFVCNMRAYEIRQSLEQDIELYKSGRKKAEERCDRLEETVIQQNETISFLEKKLDKRTGSKLNDMIDGHTLAHANGRPHQTTDDKSTGSPQRMRETRNRRSVSPKLSTKKNGLRWSGPNVPPGQMETEFNDSDDESHRRESTKRGRSSPHPGKKSRVEQAISSSAIKSIEKVLSGTPKSASLPRSEASYSLHTSADKPIRMVVRPRTRRSSTSEVIDYKNLNSPESDSVFVEESIERSYSCPRLLREGEEEVKECGNKTTTNDESERNEIQKNRRSASDTPSENSNGNTNSVRKGQRTRKRRFTSCPEYVYTQRMSITNDESILMGDDHTDEGPTLYDNLAFDNDEDISLQVLAEFDGTKTYRNEDGIPMTSL